MNGDDEILSYLEYLVDHKSGCNSESCPSCTALQTVIDSVRYRLFEARAILPVTTGELGLERDLPRGRRLVAR